MPDQIPDLAKARKHLADAEDAFDHGEHEEAGALAAIGTGYAQLAAAEVITAKPEPITMFPADPTWAAAFFRDQQTAEEARPHDDEPVIVACTCCAGSYLPVFHGARCVSGTGDLEDGGCGHSHAEHVAARESGRG